MWSVIEFLRRRTNLILLVFLEAVCIWLVVANNSFHGVAFLNSSNWFVGQISETTGSVNNYVLLKKTNKLLLAENARLREKLKADAGKRIVDEEVTSLPKDSLGNHQYDFEPARVVNLSLRSADNYLTLSKGENNGLQPGMGVVSTTGVAGIVRNVSGNFATVTSLLHSNLFLSVKIKRNNAYCTLFWPGQSPRVGGVKYLPRHIKVQKGDTLVTTGKGRRFPEGVPAGIITDYSLTESATFYEASVLLLTDYTTLSQVYVIKNRLAAEQDSLQQATDPFYQ